MKTANKKWLLIAAVIIALFAFGKYNEAQQAKDKIAQPIVEPTIELTYQEQFEKLHFDELFGGYKPIKKYLKENVNDPSSLEIDKTWNLGMTKDSTFSTKTTFRSKNAFNALVLQSIYCNIDMDGNLSEIRIE
jgi:hypothetical protein